MTLRRWEANELAFVREATAMRFTTDETARLLDRSGNGVAHARKRLGIYWPPSPKKPEPALPPRYLVSDIKAVVARHFEVRPEALNLPVSRRKYSRPRHVAMMLAREVAKRSFPDIGRMFDRDHTTVISGIRSIAQVAAKDKEIADKITAIRAELYPVDKSALCLVSTPSAAA